MPLAFAAELAASTGDVFSYWLPLGTRLLFRFPADSLVGCGTPAEEGVARGHVPSRAGELQPG
jgi:hypothetical protein